MVIISAVGHVLVSGPGHRQEFPVIPQIGLVLRVYVDGLTAVFLLLAALISVPAALYSIVYMRHYEGYSVARYYPYFLLFLAAMYGLVSTTDMMWFFFIFWQMMTLPGYALIRFEHQEPRQHPRRQQVSHHDANRLRGDHDRRRVAGRDRRGGQRQREPEV